jgi:hypothetical protein
MTKRLKGERTITLERLKELLHYDPDTGNWTWLVDRKPPGPKKGSIASHRPAGCYKQVLLDGVRYCLHVLAWFYMTGKWPVYDVDHRDRNKSNDAWSNLREGTRSQNSGNKTLSRNNRLGIKGVRQIADKKYEARCRGEQVGYFDTPGEAGEAYRRRAEEVFGEFAHS